MPYKLLFLSLKVLLKLYGFNKFNATVIRLKKSHYIKFCLNTVDFISKTK